MFQNTRTESLDNTSKDFRLKRSRFEPAYLNLHHRGELLKRAKKAPELLKSCEVCPRVCRINRNTGEPSVCKIGRYSLVSSYFAHFGEENCLRGWQGSGTIFFARCNLKCVFCQNYDISHYNSGNEVTAERLAEMMIELQHQGCHNINFITPEHVVPQIIEAMPIAVELGLKIPIVYNTSAYDSMESMSLLDGIIDIYMPDFKFWGSLLAKRYLKAKDYPEIACQVIREMHRQVGDLTFDENGLALRGLLVRHLVMPGCLSDSNMIFNFLANEISPNTYINIMNQYHPAGEVYSEKYSEVNRRVTADEYKKAVGLAESSGLYRFDNRKKNFYYQDY